MVRRTAAPRAGFTLIEVLIAMAIIAILAALLLRGISGARRSAARLQATNDISQLAAACTKFKQDFGFYPPTKVSYTTPGPSGGTTTTVPFTVPSKYLTSYTLAPTSAEQANWAVFLRMFPRLQLPTTGNPAFASADPNGATSWSGTQLNADQVLMFFLGGPNGQGWSQSDSNWSVTSGGTMSGKKGPYIDLTAVRITYDNQTPIAREALAGTLPPFTLRPRMLDPWKNPYTYLPSLPGGSYDTANGANSDGVSPYQTGTLFLNQGSVQIISAGPDISFGPGGTWAPGSTYGYGTPGFDDIANFNGGAQLGVNPNQ